MRSFQQYILVIVAFTMLCPGCVLDEPPLPIAAIQQPGCVNLPKEKVYSALYQIVKI
jgi:hypothetical protein